MSDDPSTVAGHVLASWAIREEILRAHAETPMPTHPQYGGDGSVVIQFDAVETVYHRPGEVPGVTAWLN